MTVTPARLHHLALTVSDVDVSVPWYEGVFDVKFRADVPHPGGVGKLLADDGGQLMIVLHRHDANDATPFAETVTGLDHAGFMVPSRDGARGLADAPRGPRRLARRRRRQAAHAVADRGRAVRLGPRVPRSRQHPARAVLARGRVARPASRRSRRATVPERVDLLLEDVERGVVLIDDRIGCASTAAL